ARVFSAPGGQGLVANAVPTDCIAMVAHGWSLHPPHTHTPNAHTQNRPRHPTLHSPHCSQSQLESLSSFLSLSCAPSLSPSLLSSPSLSFSISTDSAAS